MSYLRVLAAAPILASCGDIHDSDYVGEERYEIEGVIESLGPATGARTYVALSWFTYAIDNQRPAHVLGEVSPVEFPAPFSLSIYTLPGDGDWAVADSAAPPPGGVVGFGNILIFDDVDGDGGYRERADTVRGRTPTTVVYARELSTRVRSRIEERGWITNVERVVPGFQIGTMHVDHSVTIADDQSLRAHVVVTERLPAP